MNNIFMAKATVYKNILSDWIISPIKISSLATNGVLISGKSIVSIEDTSIETNVLQNGLNFVSGYDIFNNDLTSLQLDLKPSGLNKWVHKSNSIYSLYGKNLKINLEILFSNYSNNIQSINNKNLVVDITISNEYDNKIMQKKLSYTPSYFNYIQDSEIKLNVPILFLPQFTHTNTTIDLYYTAPIKTTKGIFASSEVNFNVSDTEITKHINATTKKTLQGSWNLCFSYDYDFTLNMSPKVINYFTTTTYTWYSVPTLLKNSPVSDTQILLLFNDEKKLCTHSFTKITDTMYGLITTTNELLTFLNNYTTTGIDTSIFFEIIPDQIQTDYTGKLLKMCLSSSKLRMIYALQQKINDASNPDFSFTSVGNINLGPLNIMSININNLAIPNAIIDGNCITLLPEVIDNPCELICLKIMILIIQGMENGIFYFPLRSSDGFQAFSDKNELMQMSISNS